MIYFTSRHHWFEVEAVNLEPLPPIQRSPYHLVDGDDTLVMARGAGGEGGGEGGGALLQVPRLEPCLAGRGDGEGEDRVGVACRERGSITKEPVSRQFTVTVAVVDVAPSIPAGPHKDGSLGKAGQ